jgi:hypothetical protein
MKTDSRIDQVSRAVTTLTTSCQAQLMLAPVSHSNDGQQIGCSQPHLIVEDRDDNYWTVRKGPRSSKTVPTLLFSLTIPLWLAQYSLQISVCRVAQNWTLNLKPYRTVPWDCELFAAIKRGDFDKSRYLIDSGQATVFDRDEFGQTALHVCLLHFDATIHVINLSQSLASYASSGCEELSLRMARFLIERGADSKEPNNASQ